MLQRFKLGTKLSLVVALALAAIVTIAAVGYPTLQRVKIGSPAYDQSLEYEQLIADVLPPPQYLVEPYLTANRILRESSPAAVAELSNRLRLQQVEYFDTHQSWVQRLSDDVDFGDQAALRDALLVQSYTPAETFWRVTIDEFLPAVDAGQTAKAQQLLDGSMTTAYTQHRDAIEKVVTLAQNQRALHESITKDDLDRRLRILALTVGGLVLAVALAGIALVRSIRRPVRKLTDAANLTATEELPRMVAVIERANADDPQPVMEPIVVDSKDELADLAQAFNSVRRTAIELAAKQAATRRSIAEMFVNLGRRNQALINRQLSFIDQLERAEEDPDTLEDLFRLDHLATRMRRNAESLLVLAGAEQARRWTESVDLANVVRGALSEIEEYNQVELGDMEKVLARGSVVADLAHLLAELLENATAFSPPTSPVQVTGRMLSEGYVLSIIDEGIGMDAAALADANSRIEAVASVDEAPTRVLGLYVVGRLAARHGIRVRLVPTPGRGITARVLLPLSAVESTRTGPSPIVAVAQAAPDALDEAMARLAEHGPLGLPARAATPEPTSPATAPAAVQAPGDTTPALPVRPPREAAAPPVELVDDQWDDDLPVADGELFAAPQPTAPTFDAPAAADRRPSLWDMLSTVPSPEPEAAPAPAPFTPPVPPLDAPPVSFDADVSSWDAAPAFDPAPAFDAPPAEVDAAWDAPSFDAPAADADAAWDAPSFAAPAFDPAPAWEAPTALPPVPELSVPPMLPRPVRAGDGVDPTADLAPSPLDEVVATDAIAAPPAPAEAPPVPAGDAPAIGGLRRRVRGAQMPDTGPARVEDDTPARSADDVRALLTRFRSGVERGLQDHSDNDR